MERSHLAESEGEGRKPVEESGLWQLQRNEEAGNAAPLQQQDQLGG